MGLPLYLAMTAPEISGTLALPSLLAYMACHFSSYGTGVSNIPKSLPAGSMLILNDRIPVQGHDPDLVAQQLWEVTKQLQCSYVLLDFQRPVTELTLQIAQAVVKNTPCPVVVSQGYAENIDCAVFLSAPPADVLLEAYIRPWQGREIWLEAALDGKIITLDRSGCSATPMEGCSDSLPHREEKLYCHYKIEPEPDRVRFTLQRTEEDLKGMLQKAMKLGVAGAVGLYQELGAEFQL